MIMSQAVKSKLVLTTGQLHPQRPDEGQFLKKIFSKKISYMPFEYT